MKNKKANLQSKSVDNWHLLHWRLAKTIIDGDSPCLSNLFNFEYGLEHLATSLICYFYNKLYYFLLKFKFIIFNFIHLKLDLNLNNLVWFNWLWIYSSFYFTLGLHSWFYLTVEMFSNHFRWYWEWLDPRILILNF